MTHTLTQPSTVKNVEEKTQREALLAAQARKIVDLQAQGERIQEQVDRLKAQILDQWPEGTYQAGGVKVSVRAGAKTINTSQFRQEFPPEERPNLYKLTPDLTAARKQLGEERLARLMSSRKPTVVIS